MYPNGKNEEFILNERLITIGRSKKCNIVIDDEALSRIHCEIKSENGQLFVRDLGSSNGVYYDGQKIAPNKFVPFSSFIPLILARNEIFVTDTEPAPVIEKHKEITSPSKKIRIQKVKTSENNEKKTPKNQKIVLVVLLALIVGLIFYIQEKPDSSQETPEGVPEGLQTVKVVLNSFFTDSQYEEFEKQASCSLLEVCLEFKLSNSLKEGVFVEGKDYILVKNFPYSAIPVVERKFSFLDSFTKSELMKRVARKEVNQVHLILNDPVAKTKEVIRIDGNYFIEDQSDFDTLEFEVRDLSHQKNWEGVKKEGIRGFFYKSLSGS